MKVAKSIWLLYKLNRFFPETILKTLFPSLIHTYLYGIEAWHGTYQNNTSKIFVLQKKVIRAINLIIYHTMNISTHTSNVQKSLNFLISISLNDILHVRETDRSKCCLSRAPLPTVLCQDLWQGVLQLQAWVSTKWSPINSFFSSPILIFYQYFVSYIHFYHAILQDSIRRHPFLEQLLPQQ